MCDMCGTPEEQLAGRRTAEGLAGRIRALAAAYQSLAAGGIKPHSDEWKAVGPLANRVIRSLVEDWV